MDLPVPKQLRQVGTAFLRSSIARALPDRPFNLRLWDGSTLPATQPGAPEFHAHSPAAVAHFLRAPDQLGLGRERVAGFGLSDQIEIRVADYRELSDEPFDAIASIGMVEHVGVNQIDTYAANLHRMLKPTGVLLNHGIAVLNPDDDPTEDIFSTRYVFPDGEPLPLSRIQLALERAGFETHHVEGFGRDYATTLRHWHDRLDARLDDAEWLAGAERTRIWRLYLRAARHGFEVGFTNVYQVLARPR